MLFKKDVLLLGIVLLLSRQTDCVVVDKVDINETLDRILENEQETTHTKLLTLQETPENQPNQSLISSRSDQKNEQEIKQKLIYDDVELEIKNQTEPETLESPKESPKQTEEVRSPVGYRLRSFQLRNPEALKENLRDVSEQTFPPETVELPPPEKAVLTPRSFKLPVLSPLLNHEPKVLVKSEQWVPVPADSVTVKCDEGEVNVDVKQNFLGNGQRIRPSDLTLGGCSVSDVNDQILRFRTALQTCGSSMTTSEEALVYSFSLLYAPTPIGTTFVLKTNPAEVLIECHYPRKHFVSSEALSPTWFPFAAEKSSEQQLHFSLRLMTEDWQSPRPSSVFFLSDVMLVEASVLQGHHRPLRVFVDGCSASTGPNPESQPEYVFINNHGCLTDSKLTGAKSYFMQRSQEDKLHFKLEAFRFPPDLSVYIRCRLKATTLSVPIDSQNKACSFLTEANRWVASDGDNKVCGCCESSCSETRRSRRSLGADAALQWEETTALGPIIFKAEEQSDVNSREVTEAPGSASLALLCGAGAALAVVLLTLLSAITVCSVNKSTQYDVYI